MLISIKYLTFIILSFRRWFINTCTRARTAYCFRGIQTDYIEVSQIVPNTSYLLGQILYIIRYLCKVEGNSSMNRVLPDIVHF